MKRRHFLSLLSSASVAGVSLPAAVRAQQRYPDPSRPIRFVVPAAAGGTASALMLALQEILRKELNAPVIVEHRPGASGEIGTNAVARSAPDGYTFAFLWDAPVTLSAVINPQLPYDPFTDVTPVGLIGVSPFPLYAAASLPEDLPSLLAALRSRADGVTMGNNGYTSSSYLAAQRFAEQVGFKAVHVAFNGSSQSLQALATGDVQLVLTTGAAMGFNLAKAGKIRIPAVASERPSDLYPGLPTIASAVPGYAAQAWFGVIAPARTPPEIVQTINKALAKAADDPTTKSLYAANSTELSVSSPEQMAAAMRKDFETMKAMQQSGKLKTAG